MNWIAWQDCALGKWRSQLSNCGLEACLSLFCLMAIIDRSRLIFFLAYTQDLNRLTFSCQLKATNGETLTSISPVNLRYVILSYLKNFFSPAWQKIRINAFIVDASMCQKMRGMETNQVVSRTDFALERESIQPYNILPTSSSSFCTSRLYFRSQTFAKSIAVARRTN